MKNKKLFTGSLVGLAGLSAVVAPLVTMTSCGKQAINLDKYDEIYGVDQFVYNTLEMDFKNKINAAINSDQTLSPKSKEYAKARTVKATGIFREQLTKLVGDVNTKDVAYTTVTNSMIDYAESEWGVKLNRNTKATMSDIDKLYDGLYDSWKANMKNSGMSPNQIAAILGDADKNFKQTKQSLTSKYDDALAALIKAKRLMAVVFADVNKDIGLLAASIRLQDFLENYVIEYNENGTNNKLNQLQNDKKFVEGADLTSFMGRIFNVRNAHTGELVQFRNDLIPGYKITPTLDKIESDTKKNKHSIAIDWSCVKATYTGETAKQTTAHLFNPDSAMLLKNIQDGKTATEIFNANDKMTMSYAIPKTDDAVLEDLKQTFPSQTELTGKNESENVLSFKWDTKLTAYEPFLRGALFKSEGGFDYYYVSEEDLADTGLMFSTDGQHYTRLDALNRSANNRRVVESEELEDNILADNKHFIDNCAISATVKLKKDDQGEHFAKVTLHYTYANVSVDPTKTEQQVKIDVDVPEKETSGFVISSDAMVEILNQYNKTRMVHQIYKNNVFEQDLDAMHTEKVLQDVAMGLTATFDSIIIATSLIPTTNPTQKAINITYVVTSAIDIGLQTASYTIFRINKWNVVKEYVEEIQRFKDTAEYKALDSMLSEDKKQFGLIDAKENGETDGDLYDKMYTEGDLERGIGPWKDMATVDFEKLASHYSPRFEPEVLHNYREKASEYNLGIDEYHNKLNGWDEGGKWEVMTTAFTHGSLTILGIQLVLGFFDPTITAANAARVRPEMGAIEAANQSKNLYQRTVQMFKSLCSSIKNGFQKLGKTIVNSWKSFGKTKNFVWLTDEKIDDIANFVKTRVNALVVGSEDGKSYKPLIDFKYADDKIEYGLYKNGQEFVDALRRDMESIPANSMYKGLEHTKAVEQAEKMKMRQIVKYLKDTRFNKWGKGILDAEKDYNSMLRDLANVIDEYFEASKGYISTADRTIDDFFRWTVAGGQGPEGVSEMSLKDIITKAITDLMPWQIEKSGAEWAIFFTSKMKI